MASLRAAAVVVDLGDRAIGQMAAGTCRRGHYFQVRARLGVDVAVEPRQPVAALRPQGQSTPPCAVGLVEVAVGVEDLIDTPGRRPDDVGVVLGGFAHQAEIGRASCRERVYISEVVVGLEKDSWYSE